ncbi:MAG: arginase family protein [Bacteriovorax sp.]|jgi:formiminoglutamase
MNNRDLERIINNKTELRKADILFLKFSSDIGTVKNLGRRGSLYAPQAILNVVKKLACHNLLQWADVELAVSSEEISDFKISQQHLAQRIEATLSVLSQAQKFVYLGGGHDYVYPTIKALNNFSNKIVIINLDAHLDTRTDETPNSGTPFRQLASEFKGEIEIIQLGIHDFANSISTMSNLPNGKEIVATYEDVRYGTKDFTDTDKFLKRLIPYQKDTMYFFSLDSDVMDAGIMEGVSAVNHRGLPYDFIEDVLLYSIDELHCRHFGIFEYNPVYDNLSQKGARALAALIYQIMDERSFND